MPAYVFKCPEHGTYEEVRKMDDAGAPSFCPSCGVKGNRVFSAAPDIWHTDGSHKGDYGKGNTVGDKRAALNKTFSDYWNEEPPPPAVVPPNSSEPY